MERFKFLATVSVLLIRGNKVFLIRRANTGWCDGDFELPCGHVDGGERVTSAAAREALEEVGVEIKREDLEVVHVMHRYGETKERIEFFLLAKNWIGEPKNNELDKCDLVEWFSLSELPENMVPKSKHAILEYQKGNTFSEFDWKD
jgi:mutator protein MutT